MRHDGGERRNSRAPHHAGEKSVLVHRISVPHHTSRHFSTPHLIPLFTPPFIPRITLISQDLGKDERQTLFLSEGAAPLPKPPTSREADEAELTFTNVPFEEHKIKRGGARGAGGSQTKWYS